MEEKKTKKKTLFNKEFRNWSLKDVSTMITLVSLGCALGEIIGNICKKISEAISGSFEVDETR